MWFYYFLKKIRRFLHENLTAFTEKSKLLSVHVKTVRSISEWFFLSRVFSCNKTLQTNWTKNNDYLSRIFTCDKTLQMNRTSRTNVNMFSSEYHQMHRAKCVCKLEMCKGNAHPVCAQWVPVLDLFEGFREFEVYGCSLWIDWNVCFYIVITLGTEKKYPDNAVQNMYTWTNDRITITIIFENYWINFEEKSENGKCWQIVERDFVKFYLKNFELSLKCT